MRIPKCKLTFPNKFNDNKIYEKFLQNFDITIS